MEGFRASANPSAGRQPEGGAHALFANFFVDFAAFFGKI